jgi:hypothetical protein
VTRKGIGQLDRDASRVVKCNDAAAQAASGEYNVNRRFFAFGFSSAAVLLSAQSHAQQPPNIGIATVTLT